MLIFIYSSAHNYSQARLAMSSGYHSYLIRIVMYKITLIPGDGIGPEIAEAARKCLDATGVKINWDIQDAGLDTYEKEGNPLPDRVLASIKKNKVALKGPTTTPVGAGFRSINVKLRQELNLFANFRPIKSYPGVRSKYENIDLIVVRENIEDLYAGIEFEEASAEARELIKFLETKNFSVRPDSALGVKPISIYRSKAIARFALDYARKNGRKKVTAVHKANIMKYTDGLFLATAKQAAAEYPEIEFEDRIVDNMCMQLVQKPELYDVLVLPNLYGDIISDLCSGLAGGLGTAPGANFGEGLAVFEAIHGSAPKYKGLNKVNPCALILSGVLMLKYLGEGEAADRLEKAVAETIKEGKYVTYDLKPDRDDPTAVGTREMAEEIINKM